jgi:hypothetical protein
VIVCGRQIEPGVLEWIQTAALELSPRKLAGALCERLNWRGPGGQCQVSVAVGVLRRLQELKAITLAKAQGPLNLVRRTLRPMPPDPAPTKPLMSGALKEVGPVELVLVGSRFSPRYAIWRQMLEAHHYLGSGPLAGHQLRYLVKGSGGWLGALAFSAAALQLKDRDEWIGWSGQARRENLPWVINNSRFLVLPKVEAAGLASQILTVAMNQVGEDWSEQFGYRPVLAETFVDLERYRGSCYLATNWKLIGATQGRGRQDRDRQKALSRKLVLVYPLD